jgi:hypothetical protein
MMSNFYYIEEIATTAVKQGSITAVYYRGLTGTYKVYYNEQNEIVFNFILTLS